MKGITGMKALPKLCSNCGVKLKEFESVKCTSCLNLTPKYPTLKDIGEPLRLEG